MRRLTRTLWFQILAAAVLGALVGAARPSLGVALQPVGDGFLRMVRMLIAPIVFCTVVTGIARVGGLRKAGRVGWRAFVYFEAVTTLALLVGGAVGYLFRPGAAVHVDPAAVEAQHGAAAGIAASGKALGVADFLLDIIPRDVLDAFAKDNVLQVLFFSLLFGVALAALRGEGTEVLHFMEDSERLFFRILAMVMRLAPVGAFGAMAYTVGRFGAGALVGLGQLLALFTITCALFVLVVLGGVLRWCGLGLGPFLRYLRRELLLVLGTSSSEPALPLLIEKMTRLGCSRPLVGLVAPLGYAFNLVGTSIFLTLATVFIAQATGTPLPPSKALGVLAVLLLTSKTAAAVTGGGFVALAATLQAVGNLPLAGLTLLLGVDRFLSEVRALTNLAGNAVAVVALSRWEGELDVARARAVLADVAHVEAEEDEAGRLPPPGELLGGLLPDVESAGAIAEVAPASAPRSPRSP